MCVLQSTDLTSVAILPSDLTTLPVQNELSSIWTELVSPISSIPSNTSTPAESGYAKLGAHTKVHVLPSIEHAVELVEGLIGKGSGEEQSGDDRRVDVDVLVTGSLHLVGGVMEVAKLPVS